MTPTLHSLEAPQHGTRSERTDTHVRGVFPFYTRRTRMMECRKMGAQVAWSEIRPALRRARSLAHMRAKVVATGAANAHCWLLSCHQDQQVLAATVYSSPRSGSLGTPSDL